MAEETNTQQGTRRPDAYATVQGYVQGTPEIATTSEGKEYARMRMRVPNSRKDSDGNWRNDIPSTFVDVAVFQASHVDAVKRSMESGQLKENANIRVEGYPKRRTYTANDGSERESWSITPRAGQSSLSFDKPEQGKGLSNEFEIRGAVGKMEHHEGTGKSGKPYAFITMSVANTDDPDWKAKKEGTFTGEDRTTTTWYNARVSTPKNVEALKAKMDAGEVGVGAIVSFKGSMVPETWTDKEGRKRETMSFDVKPFADAVTVIRAPKGAAEKDAPAQEAAPQDQAKGGKKAAGKKAAGKKGKAHDDEIPF